MTKELNVVFSFDTTGSMSGCIGQVKTSVINTVNELFQIPGISIGIIAHGDYCDEKTTYLMKFVDITKDKETIITFIRNIDSTCGGDAPEAYEYVLREVQKLSWTSEDMRSLVMIGDEIPHEQNKNPYNIDWRHEVNEINEMGINIYSVQCLNRGSKLAKTFYKQMATKTNGYHLYLDQFKFITEMMKAICYKQMSIERLQIYEQELVNDNLNGMNNTLREMFDVMLGRKTTNEIEENNESKYDWSGPSFSPRPRKSRSIAGTESSSVASKSSTRSRKTVIDYTTLKEEDFQMKPARPSRFQVLDVTSDMSIKEFVSENGLVFKAGSGFYEFTKPELIQKSKEIILQNKTDGLFFEGLKARKILNLIDYDDKKKIKVPDIDYRVFIQSTSYSRKLMANTVFLYDTIVEDLEADADGDLIDFSEHMPTILEEIDTESYILTE